MEMVRIFGLPAALLVLAFVANRLSKLTRVPDVIVLLLIGVTLGPVLRWVNPETFKGAVHILGMLALILILFEGGLELRLRQALRYFPAGLLLVVVSFGLSMGLIALMGRALLHLQWSDCLLMGAALGCTSGAIVIPALQQIDAPEPVKITLTVEAALGEVIAVLMVGSMLNMAPSQSLLTGMASRLLAPHRRRADCGCRDRSGVVTRLAARRRFAVQQHFEPWRCAGRLRSWPLCWRQRTVG